MTIRSLYFYQLIIFQQRYGNQARLSYIGEIPHFCFLYQSAPSHHKQIIIIPDFPDGNNSRNPLARGKLNQVYDGRPPGRTPGFRNLISL